MFDDPLCGKIVFFYIIFNLEFRSRDWISYIQIKFYGYLSLLITSLSLKKVPYIILKLR